MTDSFLGESKSKLKDPPPSAAYDGCDTPKQVTALYKEQFAALQDEVGTYPTLAQSGSIMEDARRAYSRIVYGSKKIKVATHAEVEAPEHEVERVAPKPPPVEKLPGRCSNGHDLRSTMPDGKSVMYIPPKGGSVHCRICDRDRRARYRAKAKQSGAAQ